MGFWRYLKTATGLSWTTTVGRWLLIATGLLGLGNFFGLGQVVFFKASLLAPTAWTLVLVATVVLAALTVLHAGWKLMTATEQRAKAAEQRLIEVSDASPETRILLNRQHFGASAVIEDFDGLEMNDGVIQGPVTIRGGAGNTYRRMKIGGPSS